jgi:hypothetical protein
VVTTSVEIPEGLEGSPIDPKRYLDLTFTVTHHAGALVARQLGLKVRVTAPEGQPVVSSKLLSQSPTSAELTLPKKIDKAGLWRFQVIATAGGGERSVGDAQTLNFVFTSDLLRLYLKPELAEVIDARIERSGLKGAIRSGYDVMLIVDLARADPSGVELPTNRMGLYAAVIRAGWPDAPEDLRKEQQSQLAAAAWHMVSERKPNEDMRRLKPDVDLPADLLIALADAFEMEGKPMRLVRRVGDGAFEFVHDQMHAYLAARWFAQDGLSIKELEKMVSASTIWTQTSDARRTLWGFAAGLLEDDRLTALMARVEDNEDWDSLRRALKAEKERRGLRSAGPEPDQRGDDAAR